MEKIIEEFMELVQIDSASGREKKIADTLKKKLENLGFSVTEDRAGSSFGGDTGNLTAIMEGTRSGSIMFCSHMDRVPKGDHIHPQERNNCLVSDGTTILAADDVSGLCAILDGVRRVLASGNPHPRIEIAFTVGEESGLWGGKYLDLSPFKSRICYVIDCPGPLGRIVNAAPGQAHLQVEVTGRAAHAGNEPEKGIDAAHILCQMIGTLKEGRLDKETVANFPVLHTGSEATNIVCDKAWAKGESRSHSMEKLARYVDYFKHHCEKTAEGTGASVRTESKMMYDPFYIEETDPAVRIAVKALGKMGIQPLIEHGGGGMDANIFNAKGLTAIGVATGYTKNHTTMETLDKRSFIRSGELIGKLIAGYNAGNQEE